MIDPTTFVYNGSRLQDIYLHLQSKGFEVYMPETKIGECKAPYIVVKNDGSSEHASFSTDVDLYAIMVYVPKQAYSKLEPLTMAVKAAMKELRPMIVPYGSQTSSYYDDGAKAHMTSIEYKNYKKL